MSKLASAPRHIVIRTSRETLSLVAAAGAMTFAMAYAIHGKHERISVLSAPPPLVQDTEVPQQDWAGRLTAPAPETTTPAERLSSAALVVPKAALALPLPPGKPRAARQCGDAACLAGNKAPAAAPKRQMVAATEPKAEAPGPTDVSKKSLLHQLNPLNHLPDVSTVKRPFTYAGDAVASWFWFKRL